MTERRVPTSRWPHIVAGAVSGVLLSLAFAPVAFAPLAFVALVPWLVTLKTGARRGPIAGWLVLSFIFGSSLLAWVRAVAGAPAAGFAAWLLISLLFVLIQFPLGWLLTALVRRRAVSLMAVVPLGWTAQDALRDRLLQGLTWHSPGYALADWTRFIQVADLVGVAPLSFLIVAVNVLLAEGWLHVRHHEGSTRRALALRAAGVAALAVAFLAYGDARLEAFDEELRPGPRVVGIQGNVPQAQKLKTWSEPRELIYRDHVRLMHEGARRLPNADLFVWPETSFFVADDRAVGPEEPVWGPPLDELLNRPRPYGAIPASVEFARLERAPGVSPPRFLIGVAIHEDATLPDEDGEHTAIRNSAAYVGWRGRRLAEIGRYHKRRLVPFGEYVPFRGWPGYDRFRRFVRRVAGFLPALTAGEAGVSWELPHEGGVSRFGVTICYEIVFPQYFSGCRADGSDFMINVSNDAWYQGSAELELVHAQTRFRAVENRMSIVRVSNTGISTLVDPAGRELDVIESGGQREDVEGVLIGRVPVGGASPPAVRAASIAADWLLAIWCVLAGFLVVFKRRTEGALGQALFT